MAPKGTVAVRFVGDTRNLERDMDGLSGKFRSFGGLAKVGLGAAVAGIGGLAVALGGAVKEAAEAAKIGRLTDAVIKSTGGAANVSADQVANYAEKLSNLTGVDDEAIQGGQNLLLTFTKVRNEVGAGNDIFDQATKAALDMSVALGTDMASASLQMGKALNDPIKGMTALSRAGVSFTQQQKDQVKAMVEAGDVLGAQKLILGEMTTQFGGAAAAAADPMQKLGTIVGNLQEKVGTALLPIIEKAATWLGENLPGALATAETWFGKAQDAVDRLWPAVQTAFATIRSVIETVVRFVGGVLDRFKSDHDDASTKVGEASGKIRKILEGLRDTFESLFGAISAIVTFAVAVVTEAWDRFGKGLVDNFQRYAGFLTDAVSGLFTMLSGIFDLIKAVLTGKWGAAWDAIKRIFSGAWEVIVGVLRMQIEVVRATIETVMGAVSGVWSAAWNGIKTFVADIWEGIKNVVRSAVEWVLDKVDTMLGPIDEVLGKINRLTGSNFQDDIADIVAERDAGPSRSSGSPSRAKSAGKNAGRGGDTYVTVNVPNFFGDKRELLVAVTQALVDAARSNGNALGGLA